MSIKFSLGDRWFEITLLEQLFMGKIYLRVQGGNRSTRNVILWQDMGNGRTLLKLGKKKGRYLGEGK